MSWNQKHHPTEGDFREIDLEVDKQLQRNLHIRWYKLTDCYWF